MRRFLCAIFGLLILSPVPGSAASPSIDLALPPVDCARATETVDHVICGKEALKQCDAQMADLFYDLYRRLDGTQQSKRLEEQKTWLRDRIALCPVPVAPSPSSSSLSDAEKCLDQAYRARMKALHSAFPDFTPVEHAPRSTGVEVVNAPLLGKTSLHEGIVTARDIDVAMDIPLLIEAILVRPDTNSLDSTNWVKAATCREWFSLLDQGLTPISFPPPSEAVPTVRASCEILRRLATAKAAKVSYLPENGMGDIRLYSTKIIGCTFMWECGELEDLVKCAPTIAAVEENSCSGGEMLADKETGVEGEMTIQSHRPYDLGFSENDRFGKAVWWTSLTVIARGDFTGEGVEDFLAEFERSPDTSDGSSGTGQSIAGWMILTRLPGENAIEPIACSPELIFCSPPVTPARSLAHPPNLLP